MKKSIVISGIFILLVALAACSPKNAEPVEVISTAVPQGIIAEGRLLPIHWVDLGFDRAGVVSEVLVINGDQVANGDVLAILEESPQALAVLESAKVQFQSTILALETYQSGALTRLEAARASVDNAQDDVDDAQSANDTDGSPENKATLEAAKTVLAVVINNLQKLETGNGLDAEQMAALQATVDAASANLAAAQAVVDSKILTSPMDGVISALALQPGQRVTAFTPVLSLFDPSMWVMVTDNLTQNEVVEIALGQQVEVVLDAFPQVTLPGVVQSIDPRFVEKRGDVTYTVTIVLSESDPLMRWGMTGAVHFLP